MHDIFRNLDHERSKVFNALHDIPDAAAKNVADLFRVLAGELDHKTRQLDYEIDAQADIDDHFKGLKKIPFRIQQLLNGGDDYDVVKEHLVKKLGYPPETIDLYWKRHLKRHDKRLRSERNIEIMKKVRLGWVDSALADHYDLSTRQIQRIISKELDR